MPIDEKAYQKAFDMETDPFVKRLFRGVVEVYEAAKEPLVVPDEGPFPPWMLDQFTGCGIDQLDTAKIYNLTGTHLKQLLQSYRQLYQERGTELETPTTEQPVGISPNDEQEAITVGELIAQLSKLPADFSVHANILGKVVVGITAEDIGGRYFSQVFLTSFDHDMNTEWKKPAEREVVGQIAVKKGDQP